MPMRFRNPFPFTPTPVTTLVIALYSAVFLSSLLSYNVLPSPPPRSHQLGIDLDAAWGDLQKIAFHPHPYNSRQNDVVRSYVLTRVMSITKKHSHVQVSDDLESKFVHSDVNGTTYFEGSNIVVRIEGSQPHLPAVLFSAHFDSVSTAPGATDNGMGVATLIQLIDYFANHVPPRTTIFNINNGEEDGLNGSRAFLAHPWSALPKYFINLEGAGSGGRPILFRSSTSRLTRSFERVPHPHGSTLSSDAFSLGLIRSRTDFTVYSEHGMGGLDLAFYKKRSVYHTNRDTVPELGGKSPLWLMMESTLIAGKALAEDLSESEDEQPAVYFDLFNEAIAIFSLPIFFILNVFLAAAGPVSVGVVLFIASRQKRLPWTKKGWFRYPITLLLSLGGTWGLAWCYVYWNPYVITSAPYSVSISLLAAAFLNTNIALGLADHFRHTPEQKSQTLFQIFVLWWVLLVLNCIVMNGPAKIGGLYFVTFFYAGVLLSLLISLSEPFLDKKETRPTTATPAMEESESEPSEATERTPLVTRRLGTAQPNGTSIEHSEDVYGLWILQMILLVPFPVILVTQIGLLLLTALGQTLSDGSSPLIVYLALGLLAFLIAHPIAPFAHKIHRSVTIAFLIILLGTTAFNILAFPFSSASPLKVFFTQVLDTDKGLNYVRLVGPTDFLERDIVSSIPSSSTSVVTCKPFPLRPGLTACDWPSLPPRAEAFHVKTKRLTSHSALISVHGANTRNCRLYFDDFPISSFKVHGSMKEPHTITEGGNAGKEIRLWSRTWNSTVDVEVKWDGAARRKGRAACLWAEVGDGIPALQELLTFVPRWVVVTKLTDALVEAQKEFEI